MTLKATLDLDVSVVGKIDHGVGRSNERVIAMEKMKKRNVFQSRLVGGKSFPWTMPATFTSTVRVVLLRL